jgi:Uma2 family endonuclease
MEKISLSDYFKKPETMRPMELVYGVVCEPPAPRYGHQCLVTHLGALLDRHVRDQSLGQVCVSPVDVVLDRPAALVVQPDIVFVATARLHVVRDRIWGAPDLVVEILSPRTARRDRTTKLECYRRYGVPEMWLVDARKRSLEVIDLQAAPVRRVTFKGDEPVQSRVLPRWTVSAGRIFE